MSDQYYNEWDEDDEQDEDSSGPAGLRKALKEAQKQLKAAQAQLSEQNKVIRKRTISDALAAKGLPAKLAALVPSDVEPTEEAVTAWVDEYSDVFGVGSQAAPASEGGTSQPEGQAANQSFFSESELEAQGVMSRADGAQSVPTSPGVTADKLAGAENLEELMRVIQGG